MFAGLRPCNFAAQRAFHELVVELRKDDRFAYHKRHLTIDDEQTLVALAQHHEPYKPTDSATSTEVDTDSEPEPQSRVSLWSGQFNFDLSITSDVPGTGWSAGVGRWPKLRPDMPPPVGFQTGSGILCIQPAHASQHPSPIVVDGETVSSPAQTLLALNRHESRIQIGPLEYVFNYVRFDVAGEATFQAKKQDYFRNELLLPAPHPATSATPSPTALRIGGWTCSSTVGRGGLGQVTAASNSRGSVVAMKQLARYNETTDAAIEREVVVLELLLPLLQASDEDQRVMRLVEVLYQFGERKWTPHLRPFENVWILTQPLARGTFVDNSVKSADLHTRYELLRQIVDSLAFLHANCWMHRDIKPANLGFSSLDPPKAVILDLGHARQVQPSELVQSMPGSCGTVGWLAPEMEMSSYDSSVDVWAIGVVGYEIIHGHHPWALARNPWRPGHESLRDIWQHKYDEITSKLQRAARNSFDNLLYQMLVHSQHKAPCKRISASEALHHPAWLPASHVPNKRQRRE